MKPEIKIITNKNGKFEVYYIEIVRRFLSKKEVLKPFITYAGLDDVYPFSSLKTAV